MSSTKADKTALTRDALTAVREFDKAILNHTSWLKQVHTGLICNTPADEFNLREDAHHQCDFGQWFYGSAMEKFRGEPAWERIREGHRAMHAAVRNMLIHHRDVQQIRVEEYEHFMDLAIQFKQDVRNYQFLLISQVCTVDHLTGAWNRHAMAMKLTEEYERTLRTAQPCSLCMMDLDHFKRVNDEYGHKVGDEALQAVTSLVSSELRSNDSLCRYGGEEFLILLPNTTLAQAEILLNRIRSKMEQMPVASLSGQNIHITASFGVASMVRFESPEDVLEQADHALLAAKAQGRNQVCLWDIGVEPGAEPGANF